MPRLRLAIFDLAGTVVDYGCFAPTTAFTRLFTSIPSLIKPSTQEIRSFMGLPKRNHLVKLLSLPSQQHTSYSPLDIERLYQAFIPLQLQVLEQESTAIPGAADTFFFLRDKGIILGGSTGYVSCMSDRVRAKLLPQGVVFDSFVASDQVAPGAARPQGGMILKQMELHDVRCRRAVVKIGDTVDDILEGKSIGCWTVGVVESSNGVGLRREEWLGLSQEAREEIVERQSQVLREAGADFVVREVSGVREVVEEIEERLRMGSRE